jgi:hypothetical protein
MISAVAYGAAASAGPETNRIALDTALAEGFRRGEAVEGPPGRWPIAVRRGAGYSCRLVSGNVDLRAHPEGTTIVQVGDAAGVGTSLFKIQAGSNYRFGIGGGLTLDSELVNPHNDQNHLVDIVALSGGMAGIEFHAVNFHNAGGPGTANSGDGVRIVGTAVNWVTETLFADCHFLMCGRSGIAPNRGVRGLKILGGSMVDSHDQHIDCESSTGAHTDDIFCKGVHFGRNRTGYVAVSLGGSGPNEMIRRATFDTCEFDGSGVFQGGWTENLTLRKCTVRPEKVLPVTAEGLVLEIGTITLLGQNTGLLVDECDLERYAEQGPAAAVFIYYQYNRQPLDLTFRKTRIAQYAPANVVELRYCDRVKFDDCDLEYRGGVDNVHYGIWSRSATVGPVTSLKVANSRLNGAAGARLFTGVGLTPGAGATFSGVDIDCNTITASARGLYPAGPASAYTEAIYFRGNTLGTGVADVGQSGASTAITVLGGQRAANKLRSTSGYGAPEGVVPGVVGAVHRDRATGRDHYKTTGTPQAPSTTGWVLL